MTQAERDRIEELEALIGIEGITPTGWDCRPRARTWKLFTFLTGFHGSASTETILNAIWGNKNIDERPDIKIVHVMMTKLRKGLKPYGIEIKNIWGEGFGLTPEMRKKSRELIDRLRKADAGEDV